MEKTLDLSDEDKILKFCNDGDAKAFENLIISYKKGIRRILFTALNGVVEDIEDVEQDVLLTLFKDLKKFRFQSSFKTYLFCLCRNKAIDFIRKNKRNRELLNRLKHTENSAVGKSPEEMALEKFTDDRLMCCLLKLKEEDRSMILLKDIEGLSLHDLSGIFDIPEGTVKSKLHRARKRAAFFFRSEIL